MADKIQYQSYDIENDTLIRLYRNMLKPRMIEEKMLLYCDRERFLSGFLELVKKQLLLV